MLTADLLPLLLETELSTPVSSGPVTEQWSRYQALAETRLPGGTQDTVACAALSALQADRLAWAFLCGYQQALRALVPGLPPGQLVALSVTEAGGNRPSAIRTTLRKDPGGYRLDGEKTYVTGAQFADLVLVAATQGIDDQGRPRLRMVAVRTPCEGLRISAMGGAKLVPELPHASARFESVLVSEDDLLGGDGYDCYVKPFRTVEDIHVQAAACAYLLGTGRRFDWPHEALEELLVLLSTYHQLGSAPTAAPATHLLVSGADRTLRHWLKANHGLWDQVDEAEAKRWQRDSALLEVAGTARALRRQRAWEQTATPRRVPR